MDAAGNPWLESDISPIAPGTNTSSLTFAYPQAAAEAQTLPDGTKLPHPQVYIYFIILFFIVLTSLYLLRDLYVLYQIRIITTIFKILIDKVSPS